jgi:hypothetical protein
MKNLKIYIATLVVVLAIVGGYFFPKVNNKFGAVSATGTTNNVTSWSSITFVPSTASTTSLLNNGASDRAILGSYAMCTNEVTVLNWATGAGLANFTVKAATTTLDGSTVGLAGSVNYIMNVNIATTTGYGFVATSTEGYPIYVGRIWPTGTYLTFITNATSTATCSFGVEWLPL